MRFIQTPLLGTKVINLLEEFKALRKTLYHRTSMLSWFDPWIGPPSFTEWVGSRRSYMEATGWTEIIRYEYIETIRLKIEYQLWRETFKRQYGRYPTIYEELQGPFLFLINAIGFIWSLPLTLRGFWEAKGLTFEKFDIWSLSFVYSGYKHEKEVGITWGHVVLIEKSEWLNLAHPHSLIMSHEYTHVLQESLFSIIGRVFCWINYQIARRYTSLPERYVLFEIWASKWAGGYWLYHIPPR